MIKFDLVSLVGSCSGIPRDGETIDIHVRYPLEARQDMNALREMYIQTPDGGEIPFNLVAEMEYVPVLNAPERINGQNIIKVQARMNKNIVSPYEAYKFLDQGIFQEMEGEISGFNVIPDGSVEEQAIFFDEISFLSFTCFVGNICASCDWFKVLCRATHHFNGNSLWICRRAYRHLIMGMPVSLYSFLGLFAAAGVVVNDNLVLVDCIKRLKKEGMKYTEAIAEGGRMRFRAIILTSITTFVGLVPIMLETSYQAIFIIPMVVSLTFGVLLRR